MSEEQSPDADLIWGISVRSVNGRRQWPEAIKDGVAERIRAGETVVAIAREIGANKSVIQRWLSQSKKRSSPPAFVEVITQPPPKAVPRPHPTCAAGPCTITLGDVSITMGTDYPMKELPSLIRAVRGSL